MSNGNFSQSDDQPLGMVLCLDAAAGDELWRFTEAKDAILTSVAIESGRAIFGSRDGSCYALHAETGKLAWQARIGAPVLSSPAVAGDRVFFGADDGLLYCLSLKDGQTLWSFDTNPDVLSFCDSDARIQSSPAIARGKIVFGASNGNVYCLADSAGPQPVVAQAKFKSRLMHAADAATTWSLRTLAAITGSYGTAVLLIALVTRLVLLPVDWLHARHAAKARGKPLLTGGLHDPAAVGYAMIQVCALVVLVLSLAATPILAGKPFLWIVDLSLPDRLVRMMLPYGLAATLCPSAIVLGLAVWLLLHIRAIQQSRIRQGLHIIVAFGVGWWATAWPAAPVLFGAAAIGFTILFRKMLRQPT